MKYLARGFLFSVLSIPFLADFKPVGAQEDSDFELPEPQLEVPVDIDGDGDSTLGDLYFFNWWLHEGGRLEDALGSAEVSGRGGGGGEH
jgi:hypothetical protein